MRACLTIMAVGAVVLIWVSSAQANVVMDTVLVGNAGNAADMRYDAAGYGGVAYTYGLGKYEVTAGQYTEFLNSVAITDTYGLYNNSMWSSSYGSKIQRAGSSGSYTYSVAADWANRPVNFVSWGDAARFSNWLHNGQPTGLQGPGTTEDGSYVLNGAMTIAELSAITREPGATWVIPSEDEWYKAAYYDPNKPGGAGYWDYPTTSDTVPGRDMTEATNPGNNANYYGPPYPPIDPPYYTTVGGEFDLSDSPYGTFDQGGNVWEWNEAVIGGSVRVLRGGSFIYDADVLRAASRSNNYPTNEHYYIGFRVSQVPEPATMALLVFGAVGLLGGKRHR